MEVMGPYLKPARRMIRRSLADAEQFVRDRGWSPVRYGWTNGRTYVELPLDESIAIVLMHDDARPLLDAGWRITFGAQGTDGLWTLISEMEDPQARGRARFCSLRTALRRHATRTAV